MVWAHSLVISIFGSDTNLLSNSLSSAGGVFSTFLKSIPSSEEGFLAGLRLCWSLLWSFCFLAHPWSHLLSLKGSKSWHFFHFVLKESRPLVSLHCEELPFVSLIGRKMNFHNHSLFWLVGWVFRTNFTRTLCVNLSMYDWKSSVLYCSSHYWGSPVGFSGSGRERKAGLLQITGIDDFEGRDLENNYLNEPRTGNYTEIDQRQSPKKPSLTHRRF